MAASVRIARLVVGVPDVQYARPTADILAGTWTPSSGVDLAPMIDETTPSDTDYIASSTAETDTCELRIRGANKPLVGTSYLRVRVKRA